MLKTNSNDYNTPQNEKNPLDFLQNVRFCLNKPQTSNTTCKTLRFIPKPTIPNRKKKKKIFDFVLRQIQMVNHLLIPHFKLKKTFEFGIRIWRSNLAYLYLLGHIVPFSRLYPLGEGKGS